MRGLLSTTNVYTIAVAAFVMTKTAMLTSIATLPATFSSLLVACEPYPQEPMEISFNDEHDDEVYEYGDNKYDDKYDD